MSNFPSILMGEGRAPKAPATAAVAEEGPGEFTPYAEPKPVEALVAMMTEAEARANVDQINNHSNRIGELLLELHDRQGWRALGYATWGECTESAFKYSRSRLYQLLDAARVEKNVSNMLDIDESLPARAVDQLKHLTPEQQRDVVVQRAKDVAPDSKVTAKQVEESVQKAIEADIIKPKKPKKPVSAPKGLEVDKVTTKKDLYTEFPEMEEARRIWGEIEIRYPKKQRQGIALALSIEIFERFPELYTDFRKAFLAYMVREGIIEPRPPESATLSPIT